ncbi:MAG: exodeoxyribonuclease III [Micrococcales bacterium]|nr:MAG: exodeoxyribonuclease III [Micrococcales bacterium]
MVRCYHISRRGPALGSAGADRRLPLRPVRVATFNVNGIRAAYRRGMRDWLHAAEPDVLCLQEVRADHADLTALLGPDWHVAHHQSTLAKGRAGVAVATRAPAAGVRTRLPDSTFDGAGRWVEADLGNLTVISCYVPKGQEDTPKQQQKYAFLAAAGARIDQLRRQREVLLTGDVNIAHTANDLKNWRNRQTRSGFLPAERAVLDAWTTDLGLVDVVRRLAGDRPGPYSWWSWRGQAFTNDTGWRIDYQLATPALAGTATGAHTHRAESYDERMSDHAPVVVEYTW